MRRGHRVVWVLAGLAAVLAVAGAAVGAVDGGDRANDFDFAENGTNMADADSPGDFGEGTQGFDSTSFYNLTRQNLQGLWDQNDTWTISGHVDTSNATASASDNPVFHVTNVNDAQIAGIRMQAASSDSDGDLIMFLSPCGSGNARLDDNDPGDVYHFAVKVEATSSGVWAGLWVNGTKQDDTSTSFKPCVTNDVNYIKVGHRATDAESYAGEIHDLRVWDKSLANSTIESLPDTEEEGSEQAIWTFGDSLPFKLNPDTEFNLDAAPRGIGVTHAATSNAEVYVRTNPANNQDGGKIIRFDEALALQERIVGCDGVGLRNVTGPDGLAISWDDLVAARCKTPGEDPVLAVYSSTEMLDTVKFQAGDSNNLPPRYMEANTLNRIVFDDEGNQDFYSADAPKDSVTRRTFGDSPTVSQVSIDRDPTNNVSWVAGSNDAGMFVVSSMGGVQLVDNSTLTGGVVQLHNRTVWHGEGLENITKLEIVNESEFEEVRRVSTDLNTARGLRISMDGEFLLQQTEPDATDSLVLRDAQNLSKLVTLSTDAGVEAFDMDRCNNFVYVAVRDSDGSNHKVQRFDVSGNTSTSAGGNGTSGLNPCPSNPFTQDTKGAIGEGTTAKEDPGFVEDLSARAAQGFGVSQEAASWLLGAIFLMGIMFIAATTVARLGGNPVTGAGIGVVPGLAFVVGLGLIPLWFLILIGVLGGALLVVMAR